MTLSRTLRFRLANVLALLVIALLSGVVGDAAAAPRRRPKKPRTRVARAMMVERAPPRYVLRVTDRR
jgi:hypothetical protein